MFYTEQTACVKALMVRNDGELAITITVFTCHLPLKSMGVQRRGMAKIHKKEALERE